MKDQLKKVTSNPVGAVVGGVAFYYGAKKMANVQNNIALIAIAVIGAYAGATVQSNMKAKASVPTQATVKK